MKIFLNPSCNHADIVKEAITDTVAEWCEGGLVIEAIQNADEKKMIIESDGKKAIIHYSNLTSLLRAIGEIIAEGEKAFKKEECFRFNYLGNMVDCSRNAVVNLDTLKKIIRMSALMGHNCIMLYTEDTYTIPEEPYFGHMRGRYTPEELREIDAYGEKFGIEVIPCIQTLAHLEPLFMWPALTKYRDIGNVLNVSDERVYTLIDKMLESMSKNLKSRKINVGMDEAMQLGRGKFLDKMGHMDKTEIMYKHLDRVVELCRKYGYEPMIWEDMFFRANTSSFYYNEGYVTEKELAHVPHDLNLIYFDYSSTKEEVYTDMLEKNKMFKNNKVSFAGASFSFYGGILQTAFGMNASRAALNAIFKNTLTLDTVLVTEWGDNGGLTPITASLPLMVMYGEGAWTNDISDEAVDRKMRIFGEELAFFYAMDDANFTPEVRHIIGEDIILTHYCYLHQDALLGLWDYHTPLDPSEHYRKTAEKFLEIANKNTPLSYIYTTISKLCSALEVKANLGIRIKDAYDKGDKEELSKIALNLIPECITRMREYGKAFRYQWNRVNKNYCIEIFDTRLGGALYRLEDIAQTLTDFVEGRIESIPQLEEERLPFHPYGKEKNMPISCFYWKEAISVGRL